MDNKYDVIVIGGGLAGLTTALFAKEAQNKVLVVAKGMGSFYQGPGVIDLLGSGGEKAGKMVKKPWEEISRCNGSHPYRNLGVSMVQEALTAFQELLKKGGYPLQGGGEQNLLLPTALGSIRPAYLAPQALAQGDLKQKKDILLIGIKGFHYFYPELIARNLASSLSRLGSERRVNWVTLELGLKPHRPLSAYDLALWIEQPQHLDMLVEKLAPKLGREELLGFPAVLGLERHHAILHHLQARLGRKIFEIPTLPPSVPGIRLYRVLHALLQERGVELVIGYPVTAAKVQSRQVTAIITASPGRPVEYTGRHFVLATGGIGGGGLSATAKQQLQEVIFQLPVDEQPGRDGWSREHLLDPRGQQYAYCGVQVNESLKAVDQKEQECFGNLYAAGSILAHCDPIAEKSGTGIDVATGYAAGIRCRGVDAGNDEQRLFSRRPMLKVQHL